MSQMKCGGDRQAVSPLPHGHGSAFVTKNRTLPACHASLTFEIPSSDIPAFHDLRGYNVERHAGTAFLQARRKHQRGWFSFRPVSDHESGYSYVRECRV